MNRKSQTLFGHSLSGLFVLWTLFTRPELFQTYLVFSPSIRWNKYEIMDYAKEAAYTHERKNLCMIVGGKEGFMVKDARNLYSVLQSNSRIHAEFYIAPEENHASVVPAAISRAFRFVQQPI